MDTPIAPQGTGPTNLQTMPKQRGTRTKLGDRPEWRGQPYTFGKALQALYRVKGIKEPGTKKLIRNALYRQRADRSAFSDLHRSEPVRAVAEAYLHYKLGDRATASDRFAIESEIRGRLP